MDEDETKDRIRYLLATLEMAVDDLEREIFDGDCATLWMALGELRDLTGTPIQQ